MPSKFNGGGRWSLGEFVYLNKNVFAVTVCIPFNKIDTG